MQSRELKFKIIKNFTLSFFILTFAFYIPLSAHAGFLDKVKSGANFISGFSSVPGVSKGGTGGSKVPILDEATVGLLNKEVGTKKISIPGLGSTSLPIPGASGSQDGIWYALARMAINKITKDVVGWIRTGGRDGKPLFITNWEDFLKDVANEASGIFIEDFQLTEICLPFKPRLQLLIGGNSPYYQRAQCTIKDVARNVENFYRDFKQGGWKSWFQITMVPQNNFYGSYYLALEEKLLREAGAIEAKKSEAIAGGGFLGSEICATYRDNTCIRWEITSPGTLVQDQLEEVFGSDIRQLELADEIDEIIAAAFQRLISSLRGKTTRGLLPAEKSADDPIKQFGENTETENLAAWKNIANTLEIQGFIDELEKIAVMVKPDTITKLNSLIDVLEQINSCAPKTADERIASAEANIRQIKDPGGDIENINKIIGEIINGQEEIANAESVETVQRLIEDMKAALDIVVQIINAAQAENDQIAQLILGAQEELTACQETTKNE